MSKPKKKSNPAALWIVVGVAVVVAGTLITLGVMSGNKKEETAAPQTSTVAGVKTDAEQKASRNQMGSTSAKVTVVEWGDYL